MIIYPPDAGFDWFQFAQIGVSLLALVLAGASVAVTYITGKPALEELRARRMAEERTASIVAEELAYAALDAVMAKHSIGTERDMRLTETRAYLSTLNISDLPTLEIAEVVIRLKRSLRELTRLYSVGVLHRAAAENDLEMAVRDLFRVLKLDYPEELEKD